jgi:hypothetical protein
MPAEQRAQHVSKAELRSALRGSARRGCLPVTIPQHIPIVPHRLRILPNISFGICSARQLVECAALDRLQVPDVDLRLFADLPEGEAFRLPPRDPIVEDWLLRRVHTLKRAFVMQNAGAQSKGLISHPAIPDVGSTRYFWAELYFLSESTLSAAQARLLTEVNREVNNWSYSEAPPSYCLPQ